MGILENFLNIFPIVYSSNFRSACEAQYALAWKQQARTKFSPTHGQSKKSMKKGVLPVSIYIFNGHSIMESNPLTHRFVQQR